IIYMNLTVTVNYSFFNIHLGAQHRTSQAAMCGEAARLPLPQATAKTKPQVLSAAVRPSDETFPKAARLTAAYNQQASRYGKTRFCG
ncbi:MAG: hypothetical protein ACI4SB_07285, partial [Acutalibacteraceae bacterium]